MDERERHDPNPRPFGPTEERLRQVELESERNLEALDAAVRSVQATAGRVRLEGQADRAELRRRLERL